MCMIDCASCLVSSPCVDVLRVCASWISLVWSEIRKPILKCKMDYVHDCSQAHRACHATNPRLAIFADSILCKIKTTGFGQPSISSSFGSDQRIKKQKNQLHLGPIKRVWAAKRYRSSIPKLWYNRSRRYHQTRINDENECRTWSNTINMSLRILKALWTPVNYD